MNLGMSVLAFLGIGIVVMALFCLITRYFNKKLQKALEDQNEVYSMIQEIRGKQENEDGDGEYENYVNKKQSDAEKSNRKNQPFQIQMTEVRDPLKRNGDDIYGLGKLKKRLEGDSIPLNPETGRSLSSLKSFQPQRLDSKRMNTISSRSKSSDSNEDASETDPALPKKSKKQKSKQNIVYHKYVSKIVAYLQQGILLIENNVISVSKKQTIQQKRNIKKSTIKPNQNSFTDTLEAYGFEKGIYCAYKFESTLQIPHMKQNEEYPTTSLKNTQKKQLIEFPEFYNLRDKLEEHN